MEEVEVEEGLEEVIDAWGREGGEWGGADTERTFTLAVTWRRDGVTGAELGKERSFRRK